MNEQDVRTLLDDLANTPAPPTQVDVLGAVTTVRRRRRVRVVTSAAAAVLVVGLAAGITYAAIDRSPPSTDSSDVPVASTPVTSAPKQFDPLVEYASFGWLPEQETLDSRITSTNSEQLSMSASKFVPDPTNGSNAGQPSAYVEVRLYAAGVVPLTDKPFEAIGPDGPQTLHYGPVTEAPDINGAPAYWVGVPDNSGTSILKWRYATDGWAELSVDRFAGDPREIAHRVASELRVGGTERLRFPFQVTGLPADQRPVASEVGVGGLSGPWHASLNLKGQGPGLYVAVQPVDQSEESDPNTTVDGHPARRDTVEGDHLGRPEYSDRLTVYDVNGLQINLIIDATSAAEAAPLGPDGVGTIYPNVTVHPDTANWTDQPLR